MKNIKQLSLYVPIICTIEYYINILLTIEHQERKYNQYLSQKV